MLKNRNTLTLEEFKHEMESEASKRCEVQAATITKLITDMDHLIAENKQHLADIVILETRCYVQTHGLLCGFCAMRLTCKRDVDVYR